MAFKCNDPEFLEIDKKVEKDIQDAE